MKKILLITSLFLVCNVIQAQDPEWTEPQFITDTNSVYANPYLAVLEETSWLFYEKQEETSSILKMDINNPVDNYVVLSSATVNYSFPVFYYSYNSNYQGRILYLSDEDGYYNIYAVKLLNNDSIGIPIKLIQNTGNKNITDYSLNFNGEIGYTMDSMVYVADIHNQLDTIYIDNHTLLDSSSFNIKISYQIASWQKIENDSSHIVSSHLLFENGNHYWSPPFYADSTGDCQWLTTSTEAEAMGSSLYCWENDDTVTAIVGLYPPYLDTIILKTYSKTNIRHMSMITWWFGVNKDLFEPYYLCFSTGLGDSSEIFSSQFNVWNEEGVFITDNNFLDENPKVFFGETKEGSSWGWSLWVYCVWQSHVNGNIALSMSKNVADFSSSINENNSVDNYLKVYPNPFSDKLYIEFNTQGQKGSVSIYNQKGQKVGGHNNINSGNEWQTSIWQPNLQLSKGVYIVILSINGKSFARKVVLQ